MKAIEAARAAHHWFDLRDAVMAGGAPLLDRVIVATAFHDVRGAEAAMKTLLQSKPNVDDAVDAHFAMFRMYERMGRLRSGAAESYKIFKVAPDRTPTGADLDNLQGQARVPDLKVVSRKPAMVKYTILPNGPHMAAPITINGHDAHYIIDTGAAYSMATETEAKRLGLKMVEGTPKFNGITGSAASSGHYAYAERVRFGNTELRNVPYVVLPDNAIDFFTELPEEQRGVTGMPILLATGAIRWNQHGELTIGLETKPGNLRDANLAFDGLVPVTYWEVGNHRLAVELDTGSGGSYVFVRYIADFHDSIPDLPEGKTGLTGATGSADKRSITLPELRMTVGGMPWTLSNVPLFLEPTIPESVFLYGLFGKDQFDKAAEVTLDFRAMKLTLK